MQTHMGVVIARCDLSLNNTTWAPTEELCTISQRPVAVRYACVAPARPAG